VKAYHDRLQTFSLFLIDAISYLDPEDTKWEVYFVFEKYKDISTQEWKYGCIGYATVYPFFAYPSSTRFRVSQFLILPPYQHKGHGVKLLNSIYKICQTQSCLEVSVEDPSEDFQKLRDLTDLKRFSELVKDTKFMEPFHNQVEWTGDFWRAVRTKLRMEKPQIRRIYEMYKLYKLVFQATPDAQGLLFKFVDDCHCYCLLYY